MNLKHVYDPETARIYLDRWAVKGNEKLYEERGCGREDWLGIAQERGFAGEQRAGKTVYTSVLRGQHPKASEKDALPDINQIFRITERTIEWIMKFFVRIHNKRYRIVRKLIPPHSGRPRPPYREFNR